MSIETAERKEFRRRLQLRPLAAIPRTTELSTSTAKRISNVATGPGQTSEQCEQGPKFQFIDVCHLAFSTEISK